MGAHRVVRYVQLVRYLRPAGSQSDQLENFQLATRQRPLPLALGRVAAEVRARAGDAQRDEEEESLSGDALRMGGVLDEYRRAIRALQRDAAREVAPERLVPLAVRCQRAAADELVD